MSSLSRRAPKAISPWFVRSAMALTCLLVVASFILSFAALTDLARRAGVPENLAWLWPLTVDGLIVTATIAVLALAGQDKRVTWFPWTLLFGGAAVSIAGNTAHAVLSTAHLEDGFPVLVSALVAAVPPIALLAVTHLLVVLIRNQHATPKPKKAKAKAVAPERASAPLAPAFTAPDTPAELVDDPTPAYA